MSRKRKQLIADETETVEEVKSEVIAFRVFFHESLAKGIVNAWQEREIHAFFKDLGLNDKETSDTYKIALAKY
jgi:hypothetical protein